MSMKILLGFVLVWCLVHTVAIGWLLWKFRPRRRGQPPANMTVRERWVLEQAQHPKGSPKWRAYENRLRELDGGY